MKKLAALLLSLLLICTACMAVTDTAATKKPGDELTMEINIENASGSTYQVSMLNRSKNLYS